MGKRPNLISVSGKMYSGKDTVSTILQMLIDAPHMTDEGIVSWLSKEFDEDVWSYENKKFADKIKDFCCSILGCTREQLDSKEFKEKELGEEWTRYQLHDGFVFKDIIFKRFCELPENVRSSSSVKVETMTPRKLQQLVGTEAGRNIIHPDVWVNALFSDYKPVDPEKRVSVGGVLDYSDCKFPNWIISDCRFPNEDNAIMNKGGFRIRVVRDTELRFFDLWKDFKSSAFDSWDDYLKHVGKFETVYHESETALDHVANWDAVVYNNATLMGLVQQCRKIINTW